MAEGLAPSALLARVRRDVDRSLLRTRNGLKHLSGVDRPGVGLSPKETVWRQDKVQVWRYDSDQRRLGPPVLLVMSLVSRSYILDLRPGNSVVEFLLDKGFDVFLVDWGVPDELEAANRLETYCDEYLPDIVDAVDALTGGNGVTVYGYCLGGMLSLLYAAGHPDLPLRNLAVMATPVDFTRMGTMSALLKEGRLDIDDLLDDDDGNVPPEAFLDLFRVLKPTADLTSYANLWQNLWRDEFLEGYQAITQWTSDHIPFPGACMRQTVDLFGRQNLLAGGEVPLGDRVVRLKDIRVPFLNIVAEKDHIVPSASIGDLSRRVGSPDTQDLRLDAGHVGLVVGRTAHKQTLPAIADWLLRHSEPV